MKQNDVQIEIEEGKEDRKKIEKKSRKARKKKAHKENTQISRLQAARVGCSTETKEQILPPRRAGKREKKSEEGETGNPRKRTKRIARGKRITAKGKRKNKEEKKKRKKKKKGTKYARGMH